ncbi:HlyD family secretion protein [Gallaecimonas xiamenensis]|uniref:HlyD family secretion protein n=1 Tax=Gallaecimonas xiamenensis 3-C-1 TaxID=745411 RepID=K2K446_9GAMM|nr:HlyD family efflux transporter periplasmic adaptor subunit [Gallaecimonas xiamenensis]EKE72165.1 HlyD family secretion protein [Gallaecimonas xiamenensis 3-C-1]
MKAMLSVLLLALAGCSQEPDAIYGTVERDRLTLVAPAAELVAEVAVAEGDRVQPGQVLLRLDDTAAKARRDAAQARLAQSQAALAELVKGPRQENIDEAKARVAGAQASLLQAERQWQRTRRLVADKVLTAQDLDSATAARDGARASLDSAQQQLLALNNGTRAEQLAQGQAQVAAASAELAQAEKALADLTLVAAQAALVDVLPWRKGDRVNAGSQLVSLLALARPYVRAYLPASKLSKLQAGSQVKLRIDGSEGLLDGTVRRIRGEPAFTPYYALNERDRSRLMYLTDIDLGPQGADLATGLSLEVVLP